MRGGGPRLAEACVLHQPMTLRFCRRPTMPMVPALVHCEEAIHCPGAMAHGRAAAL